VKVLRYALVVHIKRLLRLVSPPVLIEFTKIFKSKSSKHKIEGPYNSWREAASNTVGYKDDRITKKLLSAANAVLSEDAVFQRDGILFEEIEYNWPTLSALLVAQANSKNNHILDVGGGFGQTILQNSNYLSIMPRGKATRYSILEQKEIVELSSSLIHSNPLINYYSNLEDIPRDFDIVYFGSSAAYIENISELFDFLTLVKPSFIIFDRTPFSTSTTDTFYLERPPAKYYSGGSYPIRVFSESKFKNQLIRNMRYKLLAQWDEKFQPPYPNSKSMGIFFILENS
jgi:putative methyltransferase (TIGR04325 family)